MKRVILAAALLLFGAGAASARDNISFSINYTIAPYATTRVPESAPVYYPTYRTVDWRPVTVATRTDDDCRTVFRKIYRNGVLVERRASTVCTDEYPGADRYYREYDWRGDCRHNGHSRHGDDD